MPGRHVKLQYIHIYFLKTTPVGSVVSGSAAFDAPFPVPMGYMIPVELTSLVTATSLRLNGHRRHFSGESDVLEFGVFPGTPFCTHMEVSDNGGYPQIIQNHAAYRVMRSFGAGQATQLQF